MVPVSTTVSNLWPGLHDHDNFGSRIS